MLIVSRAETERDGGQHSAVAVAVQRDSASPLTLFFSSPSSLSCCSSPPFPFVLCFPFGFSPLATVRMRHKEKPTDAGTTPQATRQRRQCATMGIAEGCNVMGNEGCERGERLSDATHCCTADRPTVSRSNRCERPPSSWSPPSPSLWLFLRSISQAHTQRRNADSHRWCALPPPPTATPCSVSLR